MITLRLAEFCRQIADDGIVQEISERAKACAADAFHAILLALSSDTATLLDKYQFQRNGLCSTVGRGFASAEDAALFNSSLAAVHEIDDVHYDTSLHPGAIIVPAALAASELSGADGARRFLSAVAVGYEVAVRLSIASGYRHYHYFHSSATCGTIGAAAAAGVAMNLSLNQMHAAIGLAATSASGLWEGITDQAVMVKHLHLGIAAERGGRSAHVRRQPFMGWRRLQHGRVEPPPSGRRPHSVFRYILGDR